MLPNIANRSLNLILIMQTSQLHLIFRFEVLYDFDLAVLTAHRYILISLIQSTR